ncbi:exodeoxyribonuclease VII small subunit [Fulvivirgaceae bacterium BMA12]|uniref:Exodeoxyribonuclease VII small subunit n=1 Tax=Agaribacillus aureus TaxID=3051825 RepID=A0ABT8L7A8_9BACT|nr:exodeoxyribonuclease VII small subunit [Fulvivirgaceae bacterium BMA12]
MAEKKLNYKKALERLEEIVGKIENDEPEVDELSLLVKEASELVKKCKEKLKMTEEELDGALGDI